MLPRKRPPVIGPFGEKGAFSRAAPFLLLHKVSNNAASGEDRAMERDIPVRDLQRVGDAEMMGKALKSENWKEQIFP